MGGVEGSNVATVPDVSGDFLGQGIGNIANEPGQRPSGRRVDVGAVLIVAGARSRWTNIFGGFGVVLVVLLAAPLAERAPMPALAALLIVAGYQGLRIQQDQVIWNTSKISAAAMVLTFLATLVIPLHYTVLLGVVFSLLLYVNAQIA